MSDFKLGVNFLISVRELLDCSANRVLLFLRLDVLEVWSHSLNFACPDMCAVPPDKGGTPRQLQTQPYHQPCIALHSGRMIMGVFGSLDEYQRHKDPYLTRACCLW